MSFAPTTKTELKDAVDQWCDTTDTATDKYNGVDINNWDVSAITDMSELFKGKTDFNSDISNWNVSNVTNMKEMFRSAINFNQGIGGWNVSSVTNMQQMFRAAAGFNSTIRFWDVSKVTNMMEMFRGAQTFDKDIGTWNVSKVTNMQSMFHGALKFNQDITFWDVLNVTTFQSTFQDAADFSIPVRPWTLNNTTPTLTNMFAGNNNIDNAPTATPGVNYFNPSHTLKVDITGTPTLGQTLTANLSGSDSSNVTSSTYQWNRSDSGESSISGATQQTYTLTQDDVGKTINVTLNYVLLSGSSGTLKSTRTSTVTIFTSTAVTSATQDVSYSYTVTIEDVDGATPTLSGTTIPSWLTFTPSTGVLTGTPDNDDVGDHSVVITATDVNNDIVTQSFTITVANVNDAPTFTSTEVTSATQGVSYSYTVTTNDIDGDTVTLTGTTIPGWLTFTESTGVLTGTPDNDDVGSHSVVITASDGIAAAITQSFTIIVTNVNDDPTGTVTISGPPTQGQTLTAVTSNIEDIDGLGSFTYQWRRGGDIIQGATESTYTLTQADVGYQISVRVFYQDAQGTNEDLTSAPTGTVQNVNDDPTGTVTISGPPTQGQTLTADTSGIADVDGLGTFTYQWRRGGDNIDGATQQTYTLTQADVGYQIRVRVFYQDVQGTNEDLTSAPTSTVQNVNDDPTGTVTISGPPTQGQTLTADTSGIADVDGLGTFTYQWRRGGDNIDGATQQTYTLTQADVGYQIRVRVFYQDVQGTNEDLTSAPTGTVQNVNDDPTGQVKIVGTQGQLLSQGQTVTEDQTLTADTSDIEDIDGLGSFSYQWKRDDNIIQDATQSTYTLTQADVGYQIRVRVFYQDVQGTNEDLTSAPTGTVQNVNDDPTGQVKIVGTQGQLLSQGQTVTEDQLLEADISDIEDIDGLGSFIYQWERDGVSIPDANQKTYTLTQADVGYQISVIVSYTDGQGTYEEVTSGVTGLVENVNDDPTEEVRIVGTAREYETLTADTSLIADEDGLGPFTYKWKRGGDIIEGATESTYTLTQADVGYQIRVRVFYQDGQGTTENLTSAPTSTVTNVNDAPVFTSTPVNKTYVNDVYSYTLEASDVDNNNNSLLFTITTAPSWLTLTNNVLSGTSPASDVGLHNITLTVSDGDLTTNQTFVLSVFSSKETKEVDDIKDNVEEEINNDTETFEDKQMSGKIIEIDNNVTFTKESTKNILQQLNLNANSKRSMATKTLIIKSLEKFSSQLQTKKIIFETSALPVSEKIIKPNIVIYNASTSNSSIPKTNTINLELNEEAFYILMESENDFCTIQNKHGFKVNIVKNAVDYTVKHLTPYNVVLFKENVKEGYTNSFRSMMYIVGSLTGELQSFVKIEVPRNPINNAESNVPKAMPLKDSTSDSSSRFSMNRMLYHRAKDVNAYKNKKWYGNSQDTHRRAFNGQVQKRLDFHHIVFNGDGDTTSFTTNDSTNRQVSRQALNKTRSGGARVPAKVTGTRPVL